MKNLVNKSRNAVLLAAVSVLMIFAVSSCKKTTYYKLSNDDMSWLVYDDNELIKYKNQLGQSQEFRVKIRLKYYDVDGETYSERTSATFVLQNDTSNYAQGSDGQLYIGTGESGLFVFFSWPHFPIEKFPVHTAPQQILTLGGVNYLDVVVIDGSLLADIRNYVKTVWYSKTEGVVQYEDIYGNIWNKSI